MKLEMRERGRKIDWQYSEEVGPCCSIWRGKGTDELYSQLPESYDFGDSSQIGALCTVTRVSVGAA